MTTPLLLAFHGKQELKTEIMGRVIRHRELDELIHGTGWKDGKGCAVGCAMECYDHSLYPEKAGVPEVLAYLQDKIFENLPNEDAMSWASDFWEAIPVNADLSMIWPKFAIELLSNKDFGVLQYVQNEKFKQQKEAVEGVLNLYRDWLNTGEKPDYAAAAAAADAAAYAYTAYAYTAYAYTAYAAAYAAYAAAAAYTAYAADAAAAAAAAADAAAADAADADAAAYTAAYTAYAYTAYAAADADARTRNWKLQRDKLLELLADAPVMKGEGS